MEDQSRRDRAKDVSNHVSDEDMDTPRKRLRTDDGCREKWGAWSPSGNSSNVQNVERGRSTVHLTGAPKRKLQPENPPVKQCDEVIDLVSDSDEPNVSGEEAKECQQTHESRQPPIAASAALEGRISGRSQGPIKAPAPGTANGTADPPVESASGSLGKQRAKEPGTKSKLLKEKLEAAIDREKCALEQRDVAEAALQRVQASLEEMRKQRAEEQRLAYVMERGHEAALAAANGANTRLQAELSATQAQLVAMTNHLQSQQSADALAAGTANAQATVLLGERNAAQAELRRMQSEQEQLTAELEKARRKLRSKEAKLASAASEQETQRLRQLMDDGQRVAQELQAALSASEQARLQLQQDQQATAMELATARGERERMQQELAECRARLALAGVVVANKTATEQRLQAAMARLHQLEQQKHALEAEVAKKQSEEEASASALQDAASAKLQQLERAVADMAVESADARRECERLSAERKQLLEERDHLMGQLTAVRADFVEFRTLYTSAEARIKQIQADRARERNKAAVEHARAMSGLVEKVSLYEKLVVEHQQPASPSASRSGPPLASFSGSRSRSGSVLGVGAGAGAAAETAAAVDWRSTLSPEALHGVEQLEATIAKLEGEVTALKTDLTHQKQQLRDQQRTIFQLLESARPR